MCFFIDNHFKWWKVFFYLPKITQIFGTLLKVLWVEGPLDVWIYLGPQRSPPPKLDLNAVPNLNLAPATCSNLS